MKFKTQRQVRNALKLGKVLIIMMLLFSSSVYSKSVYDTNKGASEQGKNMPLEVKISNTTVNETLETNIRFINHATKGISGKIKWDVIDSLNKVVQSMSRNLTVPAGINRNMQVETFESVLPKGIYRIVCSFQNSSMHMVHESYYSTLMHIDIPVTTIPKSKVSFAVIDQFENISPRNQHLEGFIKDHLNSYLHTRFIKGNGKAIISTDQGTENSADSVEVAIGKYLADASLVWKFTEDKQLKKQIDSLAFTLTHTQEPDGFLGIRSSQSYWAKEDILTLKNNIAGLLAYYQATGYKPALTSSILAANLLYETFNHASGNNELLGIGSLSASSIMDPLLDLYILTGNKNYLNFCLNTLKEMEKPGRPRLISSLSNDGKFDFTDTRMEDVLSNLIAILKIYRITGENYYLTPCTAAWEGIVNDPSLLSLSSDKYENLDALNLWTSFNAEFALSTGEVSYFNQVDKAVYLSKSSAILPYYPIGIMDNHPVVLNYETGNFKEEILTYDGSQMNLSLNQNSSYPSEGRVSLTLNPSNEASFTLSLRRPARSIYYKATIAGQVYTVAPNHFLNIQRFWKKGDQIDIQFDMLPSYINESQANNAYQKEESDQAQADKKIKIRHEIRRSW